MGASIRAPVLWCSEEVKETAKLDEQSVDTRIPDTYFGWNTGSTDGLSTPEQRAFDR